MKHGTKHAFASAIAVLSFAGLANAAPSGPHPRLFLTPAVQTSLQSTVTKADSGTGRAIALCKKVASDPSSFQKSGYQGDVWSFAASACGLAYQLTKDASYAASGIKLWRALLADIDTMGDGKACVAGASQTQAIAAIKRDTGYAIRFIGPHAALAYDWLHDAPGVDDGLRSQSRACFEAWIDFYTKSGYLNDVPGANYHAGYVMAKAMIAVAEGGEGGAKSDAMWTEVVDDVFGKQLVGQGLAPKGALSGGDWAEGWQYGPLSVLHYALAARALEEQGAALPAMHQWATDLTVRFLYGLTPAADGSYVGGDTSDDNLYVAPNARVLLATIAGPGSDQAAGWASFLRTSIAKDKDDAPVFDALAEARATTAKDPTSDHLPLWYLAKGTRTVYARSSWQPDAFWAVFTSPPRVVPDHQHMDASNFVLSRGKDHLVVDPSPYGSRSSLTGNAVTVDSLIADADYKPSQTPWSEADLPWVRGTKSGVVAARSDFAKAFIFSDKPSDVPFARRDWVFLPEGEVVAIDRTRTDAASRATHMRFRSLAKLTLSGNLATGKIGSSQLAIHAVKLSGGSPTVKSIAPSDSCDSGPAGGCTGARVAVDEYALDLPGPKALAIHVLDALAASEAPADVSPIEDLPENSGVIGTSVLRNKTMTVVVASSAADGAPGATMTYRAPGNGGARHVVFDAPEDAMGNSTVTATSADGRCAITITPGGAFVGRPLVFTIGSAADGCKVADDPDAAPGSAGPGDTNTPPNAANDSAPTSGGCGCTMPRPRSALASGFVVLAVLGMAVSRKKR